MKEVLKTILLRADLMKIFSGLTILIIFGVQALYLLKYEIPEGNRDIIHILFGTIDGSVITILSFYYGSSKGSQEKTEIIKQQNEKVNS
jgi:hypothetical protein